MKMSFADNTKIKVLDFYQPMTGMRPVKGEIGVEIELEGENLTGTNCTGWVPHEDNSLRGPKGIGRGGMEYTTKGAIALDSVAPCVTRLRDTLVKAGATFREDSPRTSTHIHINVQDWQFIDVFGFITVFAAIEPLFLHLCGPRRDGNSFCSPSYDTGDLPDWFHEVFRQLENYKPGEYREIPGRGKYASLGTFRLHDLGTLECRCFPFSIDPDTIQTWCNWLVNIKNLVQGQADKSMRGVIKLGINSPEVLAHSVFRETGISPYLSSELIQYGSREAYELTRLLKFYLNKKPSEKKAKIKAEPEDDIMNIQLPTANFAAGINGDWHEVAVNPIVRRRLRD